MKNVLLTGWRSGIGAAIKNRLDVDRKNYCVYRFKGDVGKREDWEKELRYQIINKTNIWAVINCAGIAEAKPIMEINPKMFAKMYNVNCLSIFNSIQTFGKKMIDDACQNIGIQELKKKPDLVIGHIVNITSISSLQGMSYHAHYCASKFAANGLMQVAAKELAKWGILVNNVCPGPTETPMWDKLDKEYCAITGQSVGQPWDDKYLGKQIIKRLGKPEDTANVVAWLISDENTYITGTNIKVCGGNLIG